MFECLYWNKLPTPSFSTIVVKPHQLVTPESRFFIKSTIRSFVLGHPQLGFNEPGPETQVQTNIENVIQGTIVLTRIRNKDIIVKQEMGIIGISQICKMIQDRPYVLAAV